MVSQKFALLGVVAFLCSNSYALSGYVKAKSGRAVPGVVIKLSQALASDTTDATGAWSILEGTTKADPKSNAYKFTLRGEILSLALPKREQISITDVSADGRINQIINEEYFAPGIHQIHLRRHAAPGKFLLLKHDDQTEILYPYSIGVEDGLSAAMRAGEDLNEDTLIAVLNGKLEAIIPIRTTNNAAINLIIDDARGTTWNDSIPYGLLFDARDGQVYRTVRIGTQTWMAENLNYPIDSSFWYNGRYGSSSSQALNVAAIKGKDYGRLYKWAASMGIADSCDTTYCSPAKYANQLNCPSQDTLRWKGVCPDGWHLPTANEYQQLLDLAGSDPRVKPGYSGVVLKSVNFWAAQSSYNGRDLIGFRALPGGTLNPTFGFVSAGMNGTWHTSSQRKDRYDSYRMGFWADVAYEYASTSLSGGGWASIRCIKD